MEGCPLLVQAGFRSLALGLPLRDASAPLGNVGSLYPLSGLLAVLGNGLLAPPPKLSLLGAVPRSRAHAREHRHEQSNDE
jgi:hypothetical protein